MKVGIYLQNGQINVGQLQIVKGSRLLELKQDYCVLDLETTGFDPEYDDIIEICAIRVRNGIIENTFCELVQPQNPIPLFIQQLTGITNNMVENARTISEILPDLFNFVNDDVILGHNVSFDLNFISGQSLILFGKPFLNNYIDTLPLSRKAFPELKHHRLSNLSKDLSLSTPAHRSKADCICTKQLYDKIIETAQKNNIDLFKRYSSSNKLKASDISSIVTEFDEDNPFYGKICVFTGALSMIRREAMQMVADVGGVNNDRVTTATNFLIVGSTDYVANLKGAKSSKLKKAEQLIQAGQDLQILTEQTFLSMIKY